MTTGKIKNQKSKIKNLGLLNFKFLILSFTFLHYSLFTVHCFADEQTIINSETLEYHEETFTYVLKGNVKIQRGDMVIESNEITYNEHTSDIIAAGDVRYNDAEISITASRAELNLETKTGRLYDAEVFHKKDNYHISGKEIEKRGERYYFSSEATFTTCDTPVPAWCFKGKDVDALIGGRLKARDVSFRIKDIPVLYTPYLWAPILTERQTGFLIPVIDYSNSRGLHLNVPFFWAISENRDATIILDTYTKRGIGEGLEYRYIETRNIEGRWWLYHIRDIELKKDFYEFRAFHEQRSTEGIGGFLNINFVNEEDFYREFNPYLEVRANRFLESVGEVSLTFSNSRLYLLSQYWIDLIEDFRPVPHKLPELGYIVNSTKVGDFWFSGIATVSNFWRDEGVYGQRLDIYPKISYKFGREVIVLQALGLRETAYYLYRHEEDDSSPHREAIEYNIVAHTRLSRIYDPFTHIFEPSIGYIFITNSENTLPLFDSTELFKNTSKIELSLLNRLINDGGEFMVFRISQGFDLNAGDRPFLPLRLEASLKRPISLRLDVTHDVNKGMLESVNSDLQMKLLGMTISAGQRYNEKDDIILYKGSIGLQPYKSMYMEGRLWYDAEEKEVKDITIDVKYISQCWGLKATFIKKPDDFMVAIMFELRGFSFRGG